MSEPRTLIDRLWAAHEIAREDGAALLWVDRHYVHEGSFLAFSQMQKRGRAVAEPGLTFGIADHYVPPRPCHGRSFDRDDGATLEANTSSSGISLFGLGDLRQGIVHVVGPEQGLTLPGLLIATATASPSGSGWRNPIPATPAGRAICRSPTATSATGLRRRASSTRRLGPIATASPSDNASFPSVPTTKNSETI